MLKPVSDGPILPSLRVFEHLINVLATGFHSGHTVGPNPTPSQPLLPPAEGWPPARFPGVSTVSFFQVSGRPAYRHQRHSRFQLVAYTAFTKYTTSTLLETIRSDSCGGRAESAPESNNVIYFTKSGMNERIRFSGSTEFLENPHEGKAGSFAEVRAPQARWQTGYNTENNIGSGARTVYIDNLEGEIGGERSQR